MKFSWVIPTIKQTKMLFNDCIDSFVRYHGKDHELIVVEDGSPVELQRQVIEECRNRSILCIASPTNSGFPITCNKGIRASTGDIIVLVNNDIVFTQPVKEQFQKAFEMDPKIGIVGSLLFYPAGQIQHGGHLWTGNGFTHRGWHKLIKDSPECLKPSYMIGVTGALFAFRKTMLDEIGLFNENYFLACDDSEICLRAWKAGWKVFYEPEIRAIHAEGGTRGRTDMEKLTHHREWYQKEMATWNKFFNGDLKKFDIGKTLAQVNQANAEFLGARPVEPTQPDRVAGTSEAMIFEGNRSAPVVGKSSKILVRRTGALGDVLLATGIVKKLKTMNPNHVITFSTVCWDIFQNNPNVNHVVKTVDAVKDEVDQFIDLDLSYENNPKVPIWEAYAKTAFGDAGLGEFYPPQLFSGPKDYETLKAKLGSVNPLTDRIAVLHMGVSWANRTWPRHQWVEVARRLAATGYKVITVGRGADFRADLFNGISNLVDYLNIFEIRELLMKATVFIGVDSGILHIAQTTEVPIIGIFTVANPQYRIIPRLAGRTVAIVPKLECRFCLHEKAPPVTFVDCKYGTNHCLNDISPDDVIRAVDNCLTR